VFHRNVLPPSGDRWVQLLARKREVLCWALLACWSIFNMYAASAVGFALFFGWFFHIYIYIHIYTGCPRRNVPNFGRVFLRLNYTDITQTTYIQSWTVTEIMAREKCGLLAVPRTVPSQLMQSAGQVQYAFSQRPALLIQLCSKLIPKCAVSKR
jgi:hypothetical protein